MGGWKMINLQGSKFTDIMPANLASQLETQAFAYALARQIKKVCAYADGVHIYAAVDAMPENILDVLAVELRTPAYNQDYSIEVKRALIEGTMTFYAHMGTPAACNQIIETIFGNGYIKEWFECGLEPHHFKVKITGAEATSRPTDEFLAALEQVKRKSAWLDAVELEFTTMEQTERIGGTMATVAATPIPEEPDNLVFRQEIRLFGCIGTISATPVPEQPDRLNFSAPAYTGGAINTITKTPVPEQPDKLDFSAPAHTGGKLHTITTTPLAEL
jgi:phage tail P2-like protein